MFRSPVRVRTAVVAALLCAWSAVGAAGPRDEDLFIRPEDQHAVLFGSLDAGRSVFVTGGAKQSLTGPLDRSGFLLMESTGFGLTPERSRNQGIDVPVLRFTHQTSALLGYQWNGDRVHVAAFAGPEVQQEQLTYGGRVYRWSQPRVGARGQLDLWLHPSPDLLVTNTLIVSSTRTSLWNRASVGYRVFGSAFVGPEITVYATPTYREVRWGGHVTGLAMSVVTLRLSGGWMEDDSHKRGSPYIGVSAWMRL
ncbi:cellulose biosynthesis protein BcsS [uncultured Enterovirga sp.]|uniref:cellulose biosynthesis protein BcsS n=1 Tax=uncultured Enterovirga sp. TaxID=2026352 RepID=UPI0035CA9139